MTWHRRATPPRSTPSAPTRPRGPVEDRSRIVTIAAFDRAEPDGITAIGGTMPASPAYWNENRARLINLAEAKRLVVPVARTFPLADALDALEFLREGHAGGKLALTP